MNSKKHLYKHNLKINYYDRERIFENNIKHIHICVFRFEIICSNDENFFNKILKRMVLARFRSKFFRAAVLATGVGVAGYYIRQNFV